MPAAELDKTLQDLAKKGLDAKNPDLSSLTQLISLVIFFATLWWTKRQLAAREKELATARAELEIEKTRRELEVERAKQAQLDFATRDIVKHALDDVTKAQQDQRMAEYVFEKQKERISKIQSFEDLNKIARGEL